MLAHDNVVAVDRVVPPDRPADGAPDRLAAAAVAPARAGGRAVLRAVGRGRHPVRPEPQPAGHLRCAARPPGHLDGRRPAGPRPVLERHRARGRQARPRDRVRAAARRSPGACRWAGGRACSAASTSSSAATSGCSCRPGRSCRRRSSRAGRTSASPSSRATARPRPGPAAARRSTTTASGRSGGRRPASRCGSPTTARSSSAARPSSAATGRTRRRPPTAFTDDGWYRTGDIGHLDAGGPAHPVRPEARTSSCCPTASTSIPRTSRTRCGSPASATRSCSRPQPGRIEAVVLGSAAAAGAAGRAAEATDPAALRDRIDAAVKAANATLGPNQRIAGWRLWPDEDFPRTHTLKIKRAAGRGLGRRRTAAAERRLTRSPLSSGRGSPSRASRARPGCPAAEGSCDAPGSQLVEDDRRADLADDRDRPLRALDPAGAGRRGRPAARRPPRPPGPGRGTRRRR